MQVNRSNYNQDSFAPVLRDADPISFAGAVTASEWQQNFMVAKTIDNSIKVITVCDEHRKNAVKHWEGHQTKAGIAIGFSAVALTLAVPAAVAGGIILGVATFPASVAVGTSLIAVGAVVAIIGAAILCIGIVRSCAASSRIEEWKDPVQEIARHRQRGSNGGFTYLKQKSDLRAYSFAPREKQHLALHTLNGYKDRLSGIYTYGPKGQASFVDEFFKNNPLDHNLINEAFSSNQMLLGNLTAARAIYNQQKNAYKGIVQSAKKERQNIADTLESELWKLNEAEQKALLQIDTLQIVSSTAARSMRPVQPRVMPGTRHAPQTHRRRNQAFAVNSAVNQIAHTTKKIISDLYETERKRIEQAAKEHTAEINGWEVAQKQHFLQPIQQTLEAFINGTKVTVQTVPQQQPLPQTRIIRFEPQNVQANG